MDKFLTSVAIKYQESLHSRRPRRGIAATIRRLCVPKQSLAMSALRVSRDGGKVVHPLNSGSQHPELEQTASFARYSVNGGAIMSHEGGSTA